MVLFLLGLLAVVSFAFAANYAGVVEPVRSMLTEVNLWYNIMFVIPAGVVLAVCCGIKNRRFRGGNRAMRNCFMSWKASAQAIWLGLACGILSMMCWWLFRDWRSPLAGIMLGAVTVVLLWFANRFSDVERHQRAYTLWIFFVAVLLVWSPLGLNGLYWSFVWFFFVCGSPFWFANRKLEKSQHG